MTATDQPAPRFDYIAIKPACGCVVAICSAVPQTADVVAKWIKAGMVVERVPVAEAVARFAVDGCPHVAPLVGQLPLFAVEGDA